MKYYFLALFMILFMVSTALAEDRISKEKTVSNGLGFGISYVNVCIDGLRFIQHGTTLTQVFVPVKNKVKTGSAALVENYIITSVPAACKD